MNILKTIYDKDVFPNPMTNSVDAWIERPTVKIVLINDKEEIAFIANNVNQYILLPGGGVEGNETTKESIIREVREETGCEMEIIGDLGIVEDFRIRESRHSLNFCYIGKVLSYNKPSLTEKELDIGARVEWISLQNALEIFKIQEESLKKGNIPFYNTGFNIIRDHFFLKEAESWQREYFI